MPEVIGYEAPPPPKEVTCGKCKAILEYTQGEVYETFYDTGPYEVDCPRTCVRCPSCGSHVDVPVGLP